MNIVNDYERMVAKFSQQGVMTKEKYINDNVLEVRAYVRSTSGDLIEADNSPFYFNARTLKRMR